MEGDVLGHHKFDQCDSMKACFANALECFSDSNKWIRSILFERRLGFEYLLIWMVDFGKIFDSTMGCIKCWVKVGDIFWIQSIWFRIMEYIMEYCWMFFNLIGGIRSIRKQTWLCECCWIFFSIWWVNGFNQFDSKDLVLNAGKCFQIPFWFLFEALELHGIKMWNRDNYTLFWSKMS